jgi:hypothetical protein
MARKLFPIALIFSLLVTACGTPAIATAESVPLPSAQPPVSPSAQPTPTLISTPVLLTPTPANVSSTLGAAITAVQNKSTARVTDKDQYVLAKPGMTLFIGGGVQTGEDSRATLNLLANGTVIRVGPNSSFTVQEITGGEQSKTLINLLFGEIWVLLKGGAVEVSTPSGVASVRGSLLGVTYTPGMKRMKATCLEGNCALGNEAGEEEELTDDETASIEEDGSLSDVEPMTDEEESEWVNENPDAEEFFEEEPDWLPDPDPNYFDEDDYDPMAEYEEETDFSSDEDPELNPEDDSELSPDEDSDTQSEGNSESEPEGDSGE